MDNPPEINPKNPYVGNQFFVISTLGKPPEYFTIPKTAKSQVVEIKGVKTTIYIINGKEVEPTPVDPKTAEIFFPGQREAILAALTIAYAQTVRIY